MSDYLNCLLLLCYYWHELAPATIEGPIKSLALKYAESAERFCVTNGLPSVLAPLAPAVLSKGNITSALQQFNEESNVTLMALKANLSIKDNDLNAARAAITYLSRKTKANWTTSAKAAMLSSASKDVTALLKINKDGPAQATHNLESNSATVKALRRCVKKMIGEPKTFVPVDKVADARADFPEEWKEYLALAKMVRDLSNSIIMDASRDARGKLTIPKAKEILDSLGLPCHLPKGFDGYIDENGALVTKSGRPIHTAGGQPVYRVDPSSKVIMNPNYKEGADGNQWVFKAVFPTVNAKGKNNEGYFYTDNHRKVSRVGKFDIIEQMLGLEKKMVRSWRQALIKKTLTDAKIYATQCELVYDTCARVGSIGNANRKGSTYGLTTIEARHVSFRGNGCTIKYVGKDAVVQQHRITPATKEMAAVIETLRVLREGKRPKDPLWELDGKLYSAAGLRAYFRTLCPIAGASPHKIRHLRGTRLALGLFEKAADVLLGKATPPTEKQVHEVFQKALMEVGKILGHVRGVGTDQQKTTWTTAAKSYVDVGVMLQFYDQFADFNIRPPAFLSKMRDD